MFMAQVAAMIMALQWYITSMIGVISVHLLHVISLSWAITVWFGHVLTNRQRSPFWPMGIVGTRQLTYSGRLSTVSCGCHMKYDLLSYGLQAWFHEKWKDIFARFMEHRVGDHVRIWWDVMHVGLRHHKVLWMEEILHQLTDGLSHWKNPNIHSLSKLSIVTNWFRISSIHSVDHVWPETVNGRECLRWF